MYGAIIGDLAGSIYEYEQIKEIKSINIDCLIQSNSFYSDDTILTIALLDAIMNSCNYDEYLRKYINQYKEYRPNFKPYFKSSFSPGLIKWSESNGTGFSHGNGAMMRISPIGYMFDDEQDVIENARLATIPSHNSEEAINAATTIALIIYYLRKGINKEEIFNKLDLKICYLPFTKFNTTCEETLNNCLYAFYHSNSFEDSIRRTIAMGGDTDTNACIVGSMAEALYGIDDNIINEVNKRIPKDFVKVLKKSQYRNNL